MSSNGIRRTGVVVSISMPSRERKWSRPTYCEAIVTKVHDDHAEVVIPRSMLPDTTQPPITLHIPYLPHTPPHRGDHVIITVWDRDSCITDTIGHWAEDQLLDALLA